MSGERWCRKDIGPFPTCTSFRFQIGEAHFFCSRLALGIDLSFRGGNAEDEVWSIWSFFWQQRFVGSCYRQGLVCRWSGWQYRSLGE